MTPVAGDFDCWLAECRGRFGDPPRRVGWWARTFTLWLPPPPGLGFTDDLTQLFYRRGELLRTGVVTWGHVVSADDALRRPGLDDGYAVAVYGTQPGAEPPLPRLRELAATLAATDLPDPRELKHGIEVPAALAGRHPCRLGPLWVRRRHLPDRQLLSPYLPLLMLPDPPHVAMVVPARYWPAELIDHWTTPPE